MKKREDGGKEEGRRGKGFSGKQEDATVSPINTKKEGIINKICKELKKEIKGRIKEVRRVKEWKTAMEELKKQGKYIREELEGVKKELREKKDK